MATTALGAAPDDDGNGLDPLTHRQIIRRHWVNTGVVGGLTVSGGTDLYYQVAAGMAVCSMGDADGYTEAFWPGGATEHAVDAGDTTYSRIDTVYILANTGTPDNLIHVDVVQGTPSASPVKPTLPSGATAIMSMLMPAGGSTTGAASQYDGDMTYAIPYGALLGTLDRQINTIDGAVDNNLRSPLVSSKLYFPTDRNVNLHAFLCVSVANKGSDTGVATCQFWVDGVQYTTRKIEYDQNWVTYEPTTDLTVTAGWHTFSLVLFKEQGTDFVAHCGPGDNNDTYVGRMMRVNDGGVAQ